MAVGRSAPEAEGGVMRTSVTLAPDLRPELREALDGLRGEMAALRLAVHALQPEPRKAQSEKAKASADNVRKLDQAYAALTGAAITKENAPDYTGPALPLNPTYKPHYCVKTSALSALRRARLGQPGMHKLTEKDVRYYFASIWPEGAPWPEDIPRPDIPPKTKETCAWRFSRSFMSRPASPLR